ncbi:MAG: tryptophan synthase subunit alpha [Coriobacteriales bacterium]|jgi:tryptophan synthase alpha chain|nr:tryptophan synthase subunit alpha [Coriobacteriales bacterium]
MTSNGALRIKEAFAKGKALVCFVTGGDPSVAQTEAYILDMIKAGADVIEVGIPFSDPIAEGQVIQEANIRALAADTNINSLFAMVQRLRLQGETKTPILFMGYLNPILHYGYDSFFSKCAINGVDGVIVADLPYVEKCEIAAVAKAYGVAVISMIAPTTADRIEEIASNAEGFIYLVSSLGVTGERSQLHAELGQTIARIRKVTTVPVAVGFGVHSPEQAQMLTASDAGINADGVIIGSALVRKIAASPQTAGGEIAVLLNKIKTKMKNL